MKLEPKIARVLYGFGLAFLVTGWLSPVESSILFASVGGVLVGFASFLNWGEDD